MYNYPIEHYPIIQSLEQYSKSQHGTDMFVASATNFQPGYFIEFGASDGIKASNTYLLETQLKWQGILCEPAKSSFTKLVTNRGVICTNDCLAESSGKKVNFIEEDEPFTSFSHVHGYPGSTRFKHRSYVMETISLNDLFIKYNAPKTIDYLSIDTKGGEYEILKGYNFNNNIRIISIDWATQFIKDRSQIAQITALLIDRGYTQVYNTYNQEGWFVLKNAGLTQW